MGVEILHLSEISERRADLDIPEDCGGLFRPPRNGHNAFLFVGYKDESDLFEKYHHELQHAADYFIVMSEIGEMPEHFSYYTEYNAGFEGFLKYNTSVLSTIQTDVERTEHIAQTKAHLRSVFAKTPRTIFDLLCDMARISALAQIEEGIDYSLCRHIPTSIADIANFIHKYKPTREWYAEFKNIIERVQATKKSDIRFFCEKDFLQHGNPHKNCACED